MNTIKLIVPALLLAFISLRGETRVLVGCIPTGASFAGIAPLRLPFTDAETEDPNSIEAGLNKALAGFLPGAEQRGYSYICLLSAPGDSPIEIPISAAKAKLSLSRKSTAVAVVFYQGGHDPINLQWYSTGTPEGKASHVSTNFKKIAVPEGVSTAGWVYFNLTRVQAEAEKSKSAQIFVSAEGSGPAVPVPIPGLKKPLMVPDQTSVLNVSWSIPNNPIPGDILGHSTKDTK